MTRGTHASTFIELQVRHVERCVRSMRLCVHMTADPASNQKPVYYSHTVHRISNAGLCALLVIVSITAHCGGGGGGGDHVSMVMHGIEHKIWGCHSDIWESDWW